MSQGPGDGELRLDLPHLGGLSLIARVLPAGSCSGLWSGADETMEEGSEVQAAGLEDGQTGERQGTLQPFEARKGQETDSPLEPPGRNKVLPSPWS